ncbi:MAG: protein translocase subunit SecF [Pseudomonadales bacterium]
MKVFNIDFMGKRRIAAVASIVFVVLATADIFVQGLNLGLDFTGGTLVEVEFPESADPGAVRRYLEDEGFENGVVQFFGSDRDLLVRMPSQQDRDQAGMGDAIFSSLQSLEPGVVLKQSNYVGPAVGEELRDDAGLALLAAMGVIMVYILFRFTKQFAVAAVVALAHDVLVVVGCFSLFQWTFDLAVLAAVLAVIGYSLNDTIVVSDRIRENFRNMRRATPVEVINRSLNEVFGRTLVTSLTTLLVLVALILAGGETIRGFATALTIGVVVGTYSSIYVAANMILLLKISREDLMVPEKEGETQAP